MYIEGYRRPSRAASQLADARLYAGERLPSMVEALLSVGPFLGCAAAPLRREARGLRFRDSRDNHAVVSGVAADLVHLATRCRSKYGKPLANKDKEEQQIKCGDEMAKPKRKVDDSTGSLFEENYLVRTLGHIAHDPEIALTELVANAWDAGASLVDLIIPPTHSLVLTVQDDGHGMTAAQFRARWMKLGFDRTKHQGSNVEFPPERKGWRRRAYGHNGVGRHGLLCFADQYSVETWRGDKGASFEIGTRGQESPFNIEKEGAFLRAGHGTKLSVMVERHLPNPDRIRDILSARFLHDPQFVVRVNGQSVELADQTGLIERMNLSIEGCPPAEAYVVDSTRAGKSTIYQGIAFWVNGRLVGTPGWVVGSEAVLDGRARFAKRYSIVVKTSDGWMSEIEPDWARFKNGPAVDALFAAVRQYAQKVFASLSSTLVEESSEEALIRNREQFKELSQLGRAEVATFARELVKSTPTVSQDVLSAAVQALINLEKARGGANAVQLSD